MNKTMKTLDFFFDAQEIATFVACFKLNKDDLKHFYNEDE